MINYDNALEANTQYNPSKNLASKKFNHLKLPKIVRTV